MKNVPKEVRPYLKRQEHSLNMQSTETNSTLSLAERIAKKVKKDERNLLFSNSDEHRVKKEIQDIVENQKSDYEKYGQRAWYYIINI